MNKVKLHLILIGLVIFSAFMVTDVFATDWYVDSAATGSANGTSWTNAWTSYSQITGLSAGDTVYISGGAVSKTYPVTTVTPTSGTAGHPITYKIGQDEGHNGLVIFTGADKFIDRGNVTVSGDAGDGERHFEFSGGVWPIRVIGDYDNINVDHIDFGTRGWGIYIYWSSSGKPENIDISYCTMTKIRTSASHNDAVLFWDARGDGYGVNSLHHNVFYIPIKSDAFGQGDDGVRGSMWGIDIYENEFVGYKTTYYNSPSQHTDGLQIRGGSYIRIWNNKFSLINNYAIYMHMDTANFKHLRIYNNLITLPDQTWSESEYSNPGGIVLTHRAANLVFEDTWVFNNTIVDMGSGNLGIFFTDQSVPNPASPFTDCGVYNNVLVNGGYWNLAPEVDSEDNATITAGNAPATFTSYTAYNANNDYTLKETDTVLKDQGCSNCGGDNADLTSMVTTTNIGYIPPSDEIGLSQPDPPSQLKIIAN